MSDSSILTEIIGNGNQADISQSIEEYIDFHKEKWNGTVKVLSSRMKNVNTLPDLLNDVYAQRQDAVDYYYYMLNLLAKQNRVYKQTYAAEYNRLKTAAQIRYTTEASINAQIEANMADLIYFITLINNHVKYMQDTIRTIDNIIYGINSRLDVEKLMTGVQK